MFILYSTTSPDLGQLSVYLVTPTLGTRVHTVIRKLPHPLLGQKKTALSYNLNKILITTVPNTPALGQTPW